MIIFINHITTYLKDEEVVRLCEDLCLMGESCESSFNVTAQQEKVERCLLQLKKDGVIDDVSFSDDEVRENIFDVINEVGRHGDFYGLEVLASHFKESVRAVADNIGQSMQLDHERIYEFVADPNGIDFTSWDLEDLFLIAVDSRLIRKNELT